MSSELRRWHECNTSISSSWFDTLRPALAVHCRLRRVAVVQKGRAREMPQPFGEGTGNLRFELVELSRVRHRVELHDRSLLLFFQERATVLHV